MQLKNREQQAWGEKEQLTWRVAQKQARKLWKLEDAGCQGERAQLHRNQLLRILPKTNGGCLAAPLLHAKQNCRQHAKAVSNGRGRVTCGQ